MKVDDGRVVSNFIVQALKGTPITVYGDGSQTRSFCYVDDLIEGIYRLLLWQVPPASKAQNLRPKTQDLTPIFNLGNPEEVSILDFAKEVIKVTDSKSKIAFKPLPQDPKVRRPDISKAKRELSWEPKVTRQEGLRMMIPHFEKNGEQVKRKMSS